MANIVQLKRSSTPAGVPLIGDLAVAEMAFNTNDDALFISNGTTVVQLNAAANIVTDASNRFITDAQLTSFAAKQDALGFTPVDVAGDTMTGDLLLNGAPTVNLQAATKLYVDNGLSTKQASIGFTPVDVAGDTMTGALVLSGAPTIGLHAVTKTYADDALNLKEDSLGFTPVDVAGDTLTGALVLSGAPTIDLHAATKLYVDGGLTAKQDSLGFTPVDKAGDTMSGILNMGGQRVSNVGAPTASGDVTTKAYVDSGLAGLDFQSDVADIQLDAVLDPGASPTLGDRYIITNIGALHANFGTPVGVANNDVVEYDGTDFVVSYDVSVSGSGALLWSTAAVGFKYFDGTNWSDFGGLAGITAGTGLVKAGNTLDINMGAGIVALPSDEVGIDLYAAGGLQLTEDGTTDSVGAAAQIQVKLNGSTLALAAGGVSVADGGITETQLASSVAGNGLIGGGGSALTVVGGTGITANANDIEFDTAFGDARYATVAGATFTGAVVLAADPVVALGAATKDYVDTEIAGLTIDGGAY